MDRWCEIKRGYQSITNIYDEYVCDGERHQYNILTPVIQDVQQLGANNDDGCSILVEILKDAKEKLIVIQIDHSRADQLKEASTSNISDFLQTTRVIEGPTWSVEELNNATNDKHDSLVHSDGDVLNSYVTGENSTLNTSSSTYSEPSCKR
ncbi:hypothetical protein ZIOFF_031738 [Zingiber officinale]|uniref:Uncharacterized protein n=1 Tax=Zingiber officinale TaxID=94328 RepID=A0A8J5GMP6_ZINOF|nr:hypothetical protein ZIOFF_031738 [Zingiber officinale]